MSTTSNPGQPTDASRIAFEKHWIATRGFKKGTRELRLSEVDAAGYALPSTQRHWWTWQAAARALLATKSSASDAVFLIYFDDADVRPQIVHGQGGAEAMFERVSMQWNAHLFVKVRSNTRDDPSYHANVQLAESVQAQQAPSKGAQHGPR